MEVIEFKRLRRDVWIVCRLCTEHLLKRCVLSDGAPKPLSTSEDGRRFAQSKSLQL